MAKSSKIAQIEKFGIAAFNVLVNMSLKAGTGTPLSNRVGMIGFMTQCGRVEEAAGMLDKLSADILKGELRL